MHLDEPVQFILQLSKGPELLCGALEDVCPLRSVEIFVISPPEPVANSKAPISVLRATRVGSALVGLHSAQGDNLQLYSLEQDGGLLATGRVEAAPILCADWVQLDQYEGVVAAGCGLRGKLSLWKWVHDQSRLLKMVDLVGHDRQVAAVAASPDAHLLVSAGAADGTVKLWSTSVDDNDNLDAETGGIPHRRRHPQRQVARRPPRLTFKLPIGADGFQWGALAADWFTSDKVVVAGQDHWLRFYPVDSSRSDPSLKLQVSVNHSVTAVASQPQKSDNALLAVALNANAAPVLLLDVRAEQAVTHKLRRANHSAMTMRWNPWSTEKLVDIGRDALNVWDVRQPNRPTGTLGQWATTVTRGHSQCGCGLGGQRSAGGVST